MVISLGGFWVGSGVVEFSGQGVLVPELLLDLSLRTPLHNSPGIVSCELLGDVLDELSSVRA